MKIFSPIYAFELRKILNASCYNYIIISMYPKVLDHNERKKSGRKQNDFMHSEKNLAKL